MKNYAAKIFDFNFSTLSGKELTIKVSGYYSAGFSPDDFLLWAQSSKYNQHPHKWSHYETDDFNLGKEGYRLPHMLVFLVKDRYSDEYSLHIPDYEHIVEYLGGRSGN